MDASDEKKLLAMYERMLLIRRFEEKVTECYEKGLVPGFVHLYIGEEAVAVGVCSALRNDDYILSTHRGHGHSLAKGMDPRKLMAELFGRVTGCCGGIGGSMHSTDMENGILFSTAIVGGGIPIAVGAALSAKLRKTDQVVACFFGDGASNIGAFHEALNLASIWALPVVFVCENNMYAVSTHVKASTSVENISARAAAYSMPGVTVDGNDVAAVYEATAQAVHRAREGLGPTLLECKTYRWRGHGMRDTGGYRSKEEVDAWMQRCPIRRLKATLLQKGLADAQRLAEVERDVDARVQEAVKFAEESPFPPPEHLARFVFAGE
ncbi:MAG: pyruvate dehydrogenase (acetyl-transferring) E1 component subunit alpha [Candidatus Bathyarchaeia archaeon]